MESFDMPAGLSMALAADPEAMHKFATLTERQKWEVVSGTHAVGSGSEMKQYVRNIVTAY
ncbi:MAG: hypothetical protein IKP78_00915 [Ruminococcus sp.]|nr:hypothetical protein [Ruminococcus sp.]